MAEEIEEETVIDSWEEFEENPVSIFTLFRFLLRII